MTSYGLCFFFSSRRRHTRWPRDWSSDVCSSDLVDGYLCALKDAQIRGGLHILGQAPQGEALVDLVLGITRLPQGSVPSLRAVVAEDLGVDLSAGRRHDVDRVEAECRRLVEGWVLPETARETAPIGRKVSQFRQVEQGMRSRLLPALRSTPDEISNLLAAPDGRYVPPGPSGAPTR